MGNETEKNQQNPGSKADPNKKNPSQSGENVYNPQDPTKKKPGQDSGTPGSQGPRRVRRR